jgi:hypothetical protein
MEEDLMARLLAAAALHDIVCCNIYFDERPDSSILPAIVITKISPGREYDHAGWDGLETPRYQFDVMAGSRSVVSSIARALIATLEPAATVGGTKFGRSFLEGDADLTPQRSGNVKIRRRSLDFIIWNEPAQQEA